MAGRRCTAARHRPGRPNARNSRKLNWANPLLQTLLSAEGVEVGPSVLELAHQEYRLRAQPQLANTLARELDRRGSRASLSLSLSSDSASSAFNWTRPSRPPSTSSYSTSACTYRITALRGSEWSIYGRQPGRQPGMPRQGVGTGYAQPLLTSPSASRSEQHAGDAKGGDAAAAVEEPVEAGTGGRRGRPPRQLLGRTGQLHGQDPAAVLARQ